MHRHQSNSPKYWQFLLGAAFGGLIVTLVLVFHARNERAFPHYQGQDQFLQQQGYQQQGFQQQGYQQQGYPQQGFQQQELQQQQPIQQQPVQQQAFGQEGKRPLVFKDSLPGEEEEEEIQPPKRVQQGVNLAANGVAIPPNLQQMFPNREIRLPTNGKSNIPQILGTDDSTIFIAIAAYRDHECAETLMEMYQEAHSPHRLRVRIVQHVSSTTAEEETCAKFYELADCANGGTNPICQYAQNIVIKSYPRTQGRGPVDARHRVQALLDDEEFALMMDAHMKFKNKWDKLLMDNWNRLGDEMAILTTYPQGYVLRSEGFRDYKRMTVLCDSQFMEDLHIPRHKAGQYAPPGKNYLIPFWSACISFSKAHAFRAVMFDCCAPYTFDGEEFTYGIRLWTHGYDFYTPDDSILVHQYYHPGVVQRTGRKRNLYHENKWGQNYKTMRKSNERFRQMLGLKPEQEAELRDIEKYSLGNVRTRQQFIDFSGVLLDQQTQLPICEKIINGEGLPMVPLSYQPELKYTGTTIDPDPILEDIRANRIQ